MADLEIISQNPITLAEVKARLSEITKGKKTEEVSARITRVNNYIAEFTDISESDAKDLKDKLDTLGIQRLKERIIAKIIDIQPANLDELKILFAGENVTLKQEDMAKILEVIKSK